MTSVGGNGATEELLPAAAPSPMCVTITFKVNARHYKTSMGVHVHITFIFNSVFAYIQTYNASLSFARYLRKLRSA
ncbi:unnamed protein product [Ceratitis capitata]|uniref:(Mediterranean fruit fly) hypothetical protein n=1 Tax=Ceratitis capitata TaxID=7213 RepID=A0A811U2V3_CERCA|nr:unnamed protein product [Ceratitis capitata]